MDRAADNHYLTMVLDEICAVPVRELATDVAILYLWVTVPLALEAGRVIEAWGFKYSTQFVWDKIIPATALRVRNQHELLYVATRGRFSAPLAKSVSVIRARKRGHSEKPDEVYEMIERDFPGLPKIELFARARRDGWAAWGNEIANDPGLNFAASTRRATCIPVLPAGH